MFRNLSYRSKVIQKHKTGPDFKKAVLSVVQRRVLTQTEKQKTKTRFFSSLIQQKIDLLSTDRSPHGHSVKSDSCSLGTYILRV